MQLSLLSVNIPAGSQPYLATFASMLFNFDVVNTLLGCICVTECVDESQFIGDLQPVTSTDFHHGSL